MLLPTAKQATHFVTAATTAHHDHYGNTPDLLEAVAGIVQLAATTPRHRNGKGKVSLCERTS